MLKKLLISLLALSLVFLAGCGSITETGTTTSTAEPSTTQTGATTTPVTTLGNPDFPVKFSPALLNITMYAPRYNQTSNGFAKFFDKISFLIVFNHPGEVETVENTDINNHLSQLLKMNLNSIRANDFLRLTTEKTEPRTVNDYDTLRFEGKAIFIGSTDRKEYPCYAVGYTFSVDGIPCQLLGIVTDEAQSQSDIAQVTKDIDGMMKTIAVK